jgi:hypothetical protein
MIERLLLDRVDAESARMPVRGQDNLSVLPHPHKTQPALPFLKLAESRAQVALDTAIVLQVPVLRRDIVLNHAGHG